LNRVSRLGIFFTKFTRLLDYYKAQN